MLIGNALLDLNTKRGLGLHRGLDMSARGPFGFELGRQGSLARFQSRDQGLDAGSRDGLARQGRHQFRTRALFAGNALFDLGPQCSLGLHRGLETRARDPFGLDHRDQCRVASLQFLDGTAEPVLFDGTRPHPIRDSRKGFPFLLQLTVQLFARDRFLGQRRLDMPDALGQRRTKARKIVVLALRGLHRLGGALLKLLQNPTSGLDLGRDRILGRSGALLDGAQTLQDLLDAEHPAKPLQKAAKRARAERRNHRSIWLALALINSGLPGDPTAHTNPKRHKQKTSPCIISTRPSWRAQALPGLRRNGISIGHGRGLLRSRPR
ncbi:MAG: hypothetical protein ACYC1L_11070 [Alphaproteobacteria bacterium]